MKAWASRIIIRYGCKGIVIGLIAVSAWFFAIEQQRMCRRANHDVKGAAKDMYDRVADDLADRVIARLPTVVRHFFDDVADRSLCGRRFGFWAESPAQVTCKKCLAVRLER